MYKFKKILMKKVGVLTNFNFMKLTQSLKLMIIFATCFSKYSKL